MDLIHNEQKKNSRGVHLATSKPRLDYVLAGKRNGSEDARHVGAVDPDLGRHGVLLHQAGGESAQLHDNDLKESPRGGQQSSRSQGQRRTPRVATLTRRCLA